MFLSLQEYGKKQIIFPHGGFWKPLSLFFQSVQAYFNVCWERCVSGSGDRVAGVFVQTQTLVPLFFLNPQISDGAQESVSSKFPVNTDAVELGVKLPTTD